MELGDFTPLVEQFPVAHYSFCFTIGVDFGWNAGGCLAQEIRLNFI